MPYLLVTDDFFGGETGFQSILNDYYENEIEELAVVDRAKARRFIEEGLIVGGRRVGMTEGVEKERYQIDERLLKQLLDSRLIRSENTHLGKSYEVSHDTLVTPILASLEQRKQQEEALQRAAELRRARKQFAVAAAIALTGLVLAAAAFFFFLRARSASEEAVKQATLAEQALEDYLAAQLQGTKDRYNSYLERGKASMTASEYELAVVSFDQALATINNYAQDVGDADLASSIDRGGATADSLRNIAINQSGVGKRFQDLITAGDAFQKQGQTTLVDAKAKYEQALRLNYNNSIPQGRLNELEGKLAKAFSDFKKRGDTFFGAEGYQDALSNYEQAQRIRPNDDYILQRIVACKSATGSQ
ncbi:MAG: hypothetical protein AAF849_05640 [Bacteroidota bacterium]